LKTTINSDINSLITLDAKVDIDTFTTLIDSNINQINDTTTGTLAKLDSMRNTINNDLDSVRTYLNNEIDSLKDDILD